MRVNVLRYDVTMKKQEVFTVESYVNKYYGGLKYRFAQAAGIKKQKVSVWINNGYIIINHKVYSPRKLSVLKLPENEKQIDLCERCLK